MTGDAKDFAALPEGRQGNLNGNYGSWVIAKAPTKWESLANIGHSHL